jgi:oligopeptide transport system substrate-binding protein
MKRLPVPSVFVTVFLLLAACGPEGESLRGQGSGPALENSAEDDAGPAFTLVTANPISSIDPHAAATSAERHIAGALFEGLLTAAPDGKGVRPGLAKEWEVSEDGRTYTFSLRETVWTDGIPVTAQTLVDSWMRLLHPARGSPYAWMPVGFLRGAEAYNADEAGPEAVEIYAVEKYTFRMVCRETLPSMEKMLTHPALAAVPGHIIVRFGEEWTEPEHIVSNGAFLLEGPETNSDIILRKNERYWDKENLKLSEARVLVACDTEAAVAAYNAGEADWCIGGFGVLPSDMENHDDLHRCPGPAVNYYIFQTERPPFGDVRVRKALAMSVDKSMFPMVPADGIVPPLPGYPGCDGNSYDPEAAKDYLARAGFPGGAGFPRFEILYNPSEEHKETAEILQKQWAAVLGISCIPVEKEWRTYLAHRAAGNFQLVRAGWRSNVPDPERFLSMFVSGSAYNCGRYAAPGFDRLMEEASGRTGGERLSVLAKAEEVLVTEDQAVLPLYYYSSSNLIDTAKWGGWAGNVMDYHPLKGIYLLQ